MILLLTRSWESAARYRAESVPRSPPPAAAPALPGTDVPGGLRVREWSGLPPVLFPGGVGQRRGAAAADNGRRFVDQRVVLQGLDHEQGKIHAARQVARQEGTMTVLRGI
jgi:hypothetical protein